MQRFDVKTPAEKQVLRFQFAAALATGEALATIASVTVSVDAGADASPSAILNGSAQISGTDVLVPVKGGVDQCDYQVRVLVTTTNALNSPELPAILPVRLNP